MKLCCFTGCGEAFSSAPAAFRRRRLRPREVAAEPRRVGFERGEKLLHERVGREAQKGRPLHGRAHVWARVRVGGLGPERRRRSPLVLISHPLHRYQMLPAPGVYEALMMLLQMTVSACTTPLNFDMPASTVTIPAETATWLALTVTFAAAVTVMPPVSSFTELPFESTISTAPGPSFIVRRWPPGVSKISFSCPSVSSSVIFTPLRERTTLRKLLPAPSIVSGGESAPFQRP